MSEELSKRLAAIAKRWGEDTLVRFEDLPVKKIGALSSGCLTIDAVTGIGGYPKGAITELFGPECLRADSFVQYEVRARSGRRQNHKGGTLKRLHERFHGVPVPGKGNYRRPQTAESEFFVPSVNEEGRVFQNRVVDVVECGIKECLRVTTEGGRSLVATPEHKFYVGDREIFVALAELGVGDRVFVHDGTPFSCEHAPRKYYKEVLVKSHPGWPEKVVGGRYCYCRGRVSHAVYEASVNGIPYVKYIHLLNTASLLDLDGLWFMPDGYEIHHADGDPSNNIVENLVLMSRLKHGRLHAGESHNNLRYAVSPDAVVSIEGAGEVETYDIVCESPGNNYVANGLVVHNSGGKTTLALWFLAHVQKSGGVAAFINVEQKGDPDYIRALVETYGGVADDILVSYPPSGAAALDIVEKLVGLADAVVLDSVAELITGAELDADPEANFVGMQARLITKFLKRVMPKLGLSKTVLLFTNQVRANIGGFGSSETVAGGRALRHLKTLSMRISLRDPPFKNGVPCKAKVRKNQVGAPGKTAEFDIIWGRGLDIVKDTFEMARLSVFDVRSGGHYYYDWDGLGEEPSDMHGKEKAMAFMREHPDLLERIRAEIQYAHSDEGEE